MKVARYEVPGKREEGDAVPTGTIEMSLLFSLSSLIGSPKLFINLGPKSQSGRHHLFSFPPALSCGLLSHRPLTGRRVFLLYSQPRTLSGLRYFHSVPGGTACILLEALIQVLLRNFYANQDH
jgi:hypothetical protein